VCSRPEPQNLWGPLDMYSRSIGAGFKTFWPSPSLREKSMQEKKNQSDPSFHLCCDLYSLILDPCSSTSRRQLSRTAVPAHASQLQLQLFPNPNSRIWFSRRCASSCETIPWRLIIVCLLSVVFFVFRVV
jgi:hypothetical protein